MLRPTIWENLVIFKRKESAREGYQQAEAERFLIHPKARWDSEEAICTATYESTHPGIAVISEAIKSDVQSHRKINGI